MNRLFLAFLVAILTKSSLALACAGASYNIESIQKSESGSGYDMIIESEGSRYYVPEDNGLMASLAVVLGNSENWGNTLKESVKSEKLKSTYYNDVRSFCNSDASRSADVKVKNLDLLEEAFGPAMDSAVKVNREMCTAPKDKFDNATIAKLKACQSHTELDFGRQFVLDELKKGKKGDGKITAFAYCRVLDFLTEEKTMGGGLVTLTYKKLEKKSDNLSNLNPNLPMSESFSVRPLSDGESKLIPPKSFQPYSSFAEASSLFLGPLAPKTRGLGCTSSFVDNGFQGLGQAFGKSNSIDSLKGATLGR